MDAHPARRSLHIGDHGLDVGALQREVNQRLRARGQDSYVTGAADGAFGVKTARACSRALFLMGTLEGTWRAARVENGGHVSVGAQRVIRHPGVRSERQLAAAKVRMRPILEALAEQAKVDREHARLGLATAAARLALAHAPEVHYTQLAARWEGIAKRLVAAQGQFPRYADCSSFYTWCLWQLLREGPDVVNAANWTGGYTGTLLAHGQRSDPREGTAALYGTRGTTGKHVAYCISPTKVISHGSEGGPYLLDLHYRNDLMDVRTYV